MSINLDLSGSVPGLHIPVLKLTKASSITNFIFKYMNAKLID